MHGDTVVTLKLPALMKYGFKPAHKKNHKYAVSEACVMANLRLMQGRKLLILKFRSTIVKGILFPFLFFSKFICDQSIQENAQSLKIATLYALLH